MRLGEPSPTIKVESQQTATGIQEYFHFIVHFKNTPI